MTNQQSTTPRAQGRVGPELCTKCNEAPATAGRLNQGGYPLCLGCAAVTSMTLEATFEKMGKVPRAIVDGPAWDIAKDVSRNGALWLHQANALNRLQLGDHTAVATSTASGKSLIFQLWALHIGGMDPEARTIIFYPTKALGNDQLRRWQTCAKTLGMAPDFVGLIDGDVPMRHREAILEKARIIVMTPDVCHAWLTRMTDVQTIIDFLANLRLIILDEAHTYESVLGSNAAYLFRRLSAAAINAGNPVAPQYIAATATILDPEEHLQRLTGQIFTVVDEDDNGCPRYSRELHHLPLQAGKGSGEGQMAAILEAIIDNEPSAQVIAFHDSRQGVERIVQTINRPQQVLPYRSGYLGQDRKNIEDQLRAGQIRAVIATSALELGIDMPDLTHGINLDIPPTRKQFHQRLGRIGRTAPGTFVLLAPATRFSSFGETFQDYFSNSVEPSQLYVGNEYISYAQALCLKDELGKAEQETMVPPTTIEWPAGFEESLRNSHGRPPPHLAPMAHRPGAQPPQLAYGLRSTGEETLDIILQETAHQDSKESRIGSIGVSNALKEAYPGATYRHRGKAYRAEEWARNRDTKQPFIRVTPLSNADKRNPLVRTMVTLSHDDANIIDRHMRSTRFGLIADLKTVVTESVEGFIPDQGQPQYYHQLREKDPRKTRKQRDFPTTALHIRIALPWFTGEAGQPWQARHQVSNALKQYLAYNRSIPTQDIRTAIENIIINSPKGAYLSTSSIVVYDAIYGGLGLVQYLYDQLPEYAKAISRSTTMGTNKNRLINADNAERFYQWLRSTNLDTDSPQPDPAEHDWFRVMPVNTKVRLYSESRNDILDGTVETHRWQDGIVYHIRIDGDTLVARESQITQRETPDWTLWQPQTDRYRDLTIALMD